MRRCNYTGCRTILGDFHQYAVCNKHRLERAQDTPPSQRSKAEVQSLIDDLESKQKCIEAQLQSAKERLAKLPVEICPKELARLQLIEQEARQLVEVLFQTGVPRHPGLEDRTIPYLTSMFLGRRFEGAWPVRRT